MEKTEGVICRPSLSMLGNKKEKLKKLPTLIDTVSPLGQDFTKTIKNSLGVSISGKYFLKYKLRVILKSDNFSSYHVHQFSFTTYALFTYS